MRLTYFLIIFFALVAIIYLFFATETKLQLNTKVREGNTCKELKRLTMIDPETGIQQIIQFVDSSCEDGLPHTSDVNTIRIPISHPKALLPTTIRHEKIHLLQRRYPELWEEWYKHLWSYSLFDKPPTGFPEELFNRRRHNPDIEEKPFACWKNRWWSIACFTSNTPHKLTDARTMWWDSQTETILRDVPEGWSDFFGKPAQDEHPHEIAAQMIANNSGNEIRIKELTQVYETHFVKKR
jgi:hypothetical protein